MVPQTTQYFRGSTGTGIVTQPVSPTVAHSALLTRSIHAHEMRGRRTSRHAPNVPPVYDAGVGALRTSEEGGEVVGGEAKPIRSDDDGRKIDAPGQIIIDSVPIVTTSPAPPVRPAPQPASRPLAPARAGGRGVVVIVYILAAAALAAAIYERYFMT